VPIESGWPGPAAPERKRGEQAGHDEPGSPQRLFTIILRRYHCPMTTIKRTIDVDAVTAAALESRAAEAGLSVSELLADMVARQREPAEASLAELTKLDRQWAAIKAGEPTVPHEDVVRWLDTWGTPRFRPWNRAVGRISQRCNLPPFQARRIALR